MESHSDKIKKLKAEIAQLETELSQKKEDLALLQTIPEQVAENEATVLNTSSPEEKIKLFRSLFRGRDDVFARRFESKKTGKSGYQPACSNEC